MNFMENISFPLLQNLKTVTERKFESWKVLKNFNIHIVLGDMSILKILKSTFDNNQPTFDIKVNATAWRMSQNVARRTRIVPSMLHGNTLKSGFKFFHLIYDE